MSARLSSPFSARTRRGSEKSPVFRIGESGGYSFSRPKSLAAVRVAPGVEVGRCAPVQRLVARETQLVRGEHVAERRKARHPLGVVRERLGHDCVLPLHERVLDAAHRAHRGEQRVRARVHQVRHVPQVDLGHAVDARLVAGAVDHDGRMPPREGYDRGELGHGDEVGRLDVHRHAQLVRRLQVLRRRHERVEAHEVEPQFLPLRGDHAVVVQVARQVDRLRKIAMLSHAPQVDRPAVET